MNTSISTEWIKIAALVALVALNSWSQLRPAPAPAPVVINPVVKPDGPTPLPPPVAPPTPAPVASEPSLSFPAAGVYVVRVQIGDQQGAVIANVDAPGTYPVSLAAQPR